MEWSLRLLELLRPWRGLDWGLWLTLDHWLNTFFHILPFFSFCCSIQNLKPRVLLLLRCR